MTQTPKPAVTTKRTLAQTRGHTPGDEQIDEEAALAAAKAERTEAVAAFLADVDTTDDAVCPDLPDAEENNGDLEPDFDAPDAATSPPLPPLTLPVAATPWQAMVLGAVAALYESPPDGQLFMAGKGIAAAFGDTRPFETDTANPSRSWADSLTPAEVQAAIVQGHDPYARAKGGKTCRPLRMIKREFLVALVALARAVETPEALRELCIPGQITVIEGMENSVFARMPGFLEQILPALTGFTTAPSVKLVDGKYSPDLLAQEMVNELEYGAASILLLRNGSNLPKSVLPTLDRRLSLTVPDADALVFLLRLTHSTTGRIAEDAVRALLPPDHRLRGVSPADLMLALRKPNAVQVARHLAQITAGKSGAWRTLANYPMNAEVRAAANRLTSDISEWRAGRRDWSDCQTGILLSGPPGVGKTDFARTLAEAAGITLVEAGPAKTIGAGHLGDTLRLLQETLATAKRAAPSILLLDEFDAVGSRGDNDRHKGYRDGLIGGYLTMLDGVEGREGVFILAATNFPENIDPALVRAGRFDLHLRLDRPDPEMLVEVLRWHLGDDLVGEDLTPLIPLAAHLTQADCARAIRSARATARSAKRELRIADIEAVLTTDPPLSPTDRRRVAVHEAGHALTRYLLCNALPERMMITPIGGHVMHIADGALTLAQDYRKELAVWLAGRAAEKVILGTVSAGSGGGAGSDLAVATKIATIFETCTGLGSSGLLWSAPPEQAFNLLRTDPDLADRVTGHLNDATTIAETLLRKHRKTLEALAAALTARGYLAKADVEGVLKGA